MEDSKRREKLAGERIQRVSEENEALKLDVGDARTELRNLREEFREVARIMRAQSGS